MNRLEELAGELAKAVAWQKAIIRSDENGDCIIGWDYCWNEYEFNALLIPKRALFTAEQITEARAPLLAEIDRLKAQVAELGKEAARYRRLESVAREKLLRPERVNCEYLPDRRTHWALPIIMCSGPIGGFVSFGEAVDSLDTAMKEKQ